MADCAFLVDSWCKPAAAVRRIGVNWEEQLFPGETLTGTPTFAVSPAGPTFAGAANSNADPRSSTALVSGGTAAADYVVTVTAVTSAGQTLIAKGNLHVE